MKPAAKIQEKASWTAIQLTSYFRGQKLKAATGLLYIYEGRSFLITNAHVVTGRHSETNEPLDPNTPAPDELGVLMSYMQTHPDTGVTAVRRNEKRLPLFHDGDESRPTWLRHPVLGHKFDVVAIEFAPEGARNVAANAIYEARDDIDPFPSMNSFVIGFPLNMSASGFPILKRASVASEPDIDVDGLPKFYIDTATREGMSGSPVFLQAGPLFGDGDRLTIGSTMIFAGVYSGRIGNDPFFAQLGVVWKVSGLVSLLAGSPRIHG